ncbi:LytTR family DNA-binding domain-containing protein [Puia sp.]|jgi:DNA-binding LytR/AlgR family response regulator|uniref:LytR/AlgR family response regulator transcription factor n=1 Tax=Puia sp. TaxID=2045100 RepID=UPI002F402658
MLKSIAVDDEPVALEVIRKFGAGVPYIDLLATFTRASKAAEYLHKTETDLLFLDIKMPDISGIDLIRSLPRPPMVIFTTAYSNHAVESFELDAIDFLLKPFSETRFRKACGRAFHQAELKQSFRSTVAGPPAIFVKTGYDQVRVPLDEILYVEGSGNYVQFMLKGEKILSRVTLAEVEKLLPAPAFLRIHRSYIVGVRHIRRLEKTQVLVNGVFLPISPNYSEAVEKLTRP